MPINELSDHSKIATLFKSCVSPSSTEDRYKWNKLTRFKWNKKNKMKFCTSLLLNENYIDEISQRIEAGLIESTGVKIQNLYLKVAKMTLEEKGNKTQKNWKKRKKSKKWFDVECHNLKKDVRKAGREKHERPNGTLLKTKYHEKLKSIKISASLRDIYFGKTQ